MGNKRERLHAFLTSAQRHRSGVNQQRKKAASEEKARRDARRKAEAEAQVEAEAAGERAVLDAERVEPDEVKLDLLRKADGYERRRLVRQDNREMVKEVLKLMEETPLADVD
ncbi:hypothetical protein LTR36_004180 [Oleoguttula mirabilis]|uniref:Uncharacterized protein n=1 Tax=Oleoguttula mirabilis TaxID=1507867 RepID=A0AAV9JHE6_9PEZI|nr:hypothetical protein LTR36_004180 [Oleoguttula mirabilis]